ncbi:hypothetical protein GA0115246_105971 [Streptomyces sp. SolWspMP-sol7th]|nr:hypothetical protein GA0115246_105971 [Streptomyces sp. SolWspMP-sol7th]
MPRFHEVTVFHHSAPVAPATGSSLVLDGDRSGPVSHTAVLSAVDPGRAPAGRALVSSTVPGRPPAGLDGPVRAHLAALYGVPTRDWDLLAVHHDAEAVPAMARRTTRAAWSASWTASTCAATTATRARSRAPSAQAAAPPTRSCATSA